MLTKREQWEKDRQAVANTYFGGNLDSAQSALEAMPYVPDLGWDDLEDILVILADLGWRKPNA